MLQHIIDQRRVWHVLFATPLRSSPTSVQSPYSLSTGSTVATSLPGQQVQSVLYPPSGSRVNASGLPKSAHGKLKLNWCALVSIVLGALCFSTVLSFTFGSSWVYAGGESLSLVLVIVTPILNGIAIVCGHIGLRLTGSSGQQTGRSDVWIGLSQAGLFISYLSLAFYIVLVLAVFFS